MDQQHRMIAVIETGPYLARAKTRLSEDEQAAVVNVVASQPDAGVVIPSGGGIRKIRIAIGGKGKSGGARVIYYYHADDVPVFLLTVFTKGEQANLTAAERNALGVAAKRLATKYREVQHGKRSI